MRIDSHTHVFPPDIVRERESMFERDSFFRELYESPRAKLATAEDLVAELDRVGFDRAVVLGWGWIDHALCVAHNDYLIDAVQRFPDRLIGFAAIQPTAADRALAEAERAVKAGLRGIGELMPHGQGYALDQTPLLAPLAELAVALDVPILTHTSEPVGHVYPGKGDVTIQTVIHLATSFPELKLICGHWGGGLPFYELMASVAKVTGNVSYDSAASVFLYDPRIYSVAASIVGADRILFGSDYPLVGMARAAQQVTGPDADAILGGNAARVLAL